MPKEKIESLDFTQDMQKEIFASILACSKLGWEDPKYVSLCISILKPESFDNPVLQNFFKIIKNFYREYDEIFTPPQFREEVKSFLNLDKNKNLPEDEYLNVLFDILKLEREANFDYSRDKIIKFAQHQVGKNILMDGIRKHLPKLEFDKMIENLEKTRDMGIQFADEDAGLKIIPLNEVEAEKIDWLWWEVIPKGKLTIICGDPNVGKSFLTMFLASYVTKGKPLPHTSNRITKKGSVLILTAEDGVADTVRPRIDSTNGDPSKVNIIDGIKERDSIKLFNFRDDIEKLGIFLEKRKDIKLLIIDPITAYMSGIDMKMDAEVRGKILAPLSALAEKHEISIILVAHLNKDVAMKAVYRISGTVGFLAGVRSVWLVMNDDEDKTGEKRKFCCLKMNIAKKPDKAMVFRIFGTDKDEPNLTFTDEFSYVDIEAELSGKQGPIHIAQDFLKSILKHGRRKSTEIDEAARANDIKIRTLKTAKAKLGIVSEKEGKEWFYKLPEKSEQKGNKK